MSVSITLFICRISLGVGDGSIILNINQQKVILLLKILIRTKIGKKLIQRLNNVNFSRWRDLTPLKVGMLTSNWNQSENTQPIQPAIDT